MPAVIPASSPAVIPLGISVAEAQALPSGVSLAESNVAITGPRGERMNEMVEIAIAGPEENRSDRTDTSPGYSLVVHPKDTQAFKPGKYSVSADIKTTHGTRHLAQDFLWGVLAINPNKSVYRPGETANLALAVLDERGNMVCDADVRLQIQTPDKSYKTYTTYKTYTSDRSDMIRVNEECRQKRVTQRPDYEATYLTQGPGTYQMTLTATTKNGTYTIQDYFEAVDRSDRSDKSLFDIERITATRIYPVHEYPVTIRVTPEGDFKGVVREYVPASFQISNQKPSNEKTALASGISGGDSTPDEDTNMVCHPGTNLTLNDRKNSVKCFEKEKQAGDVGGEGSRTPNTEVTNPAFSPEHPQTSTQPASALYHNSISWQVDWKVIPL